MSTLAGELESLLGVEQRDVTRTSSANRIRIQPLDCELTPTGRAFFADTHNISSAGVGVISGAPLETQFVRISFLATDASVFAQVVHATDIGDDYPLYLVGLRFLK